MTLQGNGTQTCFLVDNFLELVEQAFWIDWKIYKEKGNA